MLVARAKGKPSEVIKQAIAAAGLGGEEAAAAAFAADEVLANGVDYAALNAERTKHAGGRGDKDDENS